MKIHRRNCAFALLLVVTPTFSGCRQLAQQAVQSIAKRASNTNAGSVDTAYVNALTPSNSGNGLLVGTPVTTDAKLQRFAAGYGRWLYLHAAGQGELGKSPNWGMIEEVRRGRKAPSLEIAAKDAASWAQWTGVTHVAVGTLAAQSGKFRLEYQLVTADGKPFKKFPAVVGNQQQIVAALPSLARQMDLALGVKSPQVPTKVALTPDDLAFLGGLPWKAKHKDKLLSFDVPRVSTLAAKDALAAVLYQRGDAVPSHGEWTKVVGALLKNGRGNTMVIGEIEWMGAHMLNSHRPLVDALNKKFPNNFQLLLGDSAFQDMGKQLALRVASAEKAVQAAPGSPLAWQNLSDALGDYADQIRRGRYSRDISSKDWAALHKIYGQYEAAATKLTQLHPQYSYGWSELARAATFNSNPKTADNAVWTALKLNPANDEAYNWGFQMYQPKWTSGNAPKMLNLAKMAAANAGKCPVSAETMVTALKATNQKNQILPLLNAMLVSEPTHAEANFELGEYYHWTQINYPLSEQHYRRAIQLSPNYAGPYSGLGDILIFTKNDPVGAEGAYRQAVRLRPTDGYLHANLGRCLAMQGKNAEAVTMAQTAKNLGYKDSNHPIWGMTGVQP